MATPEDVGRATLFLASESSSWITGVTLDVAGGLIIVRGRKGARYERLSSGATEDKKLTSENAVWAKFGIPRPRRPRTAGEDLSYCQVSCARTAGESATFRDIWSGAKRRVGAP
jgi:hypothetical protein